MLIERLFERIKEHAEIACLTELHLYVEVGILLPTPKVIHYIWMFSEACHTLNLAHVSISIHTTKKFSLTHFYCTECTSFPISSFVNLPSTCQYRSIASNNVYYAKQFSDIRNIMNVGDSSIYHTEGLVENSMNRNDMFMQLVIG